MEGIFRLLDFLSEIEIIVIAEVRRGKTSFKSFIREKKKKIVSWKCESMNRQGNVDQSLGLIPQEGASFC